MVSCGAAGAGERADSAGASDARQADCRHAAAAGALDLRANQRGESARKRIADVAYGCAGAGCAGDLDLLVRAGAAGDCAGGAAAQYDVAGIPGVHAESAAGDYRGGGGADPAAARCVGTRVEFVDRLLRAVQLTRGMRKTLRIPL